jgi:bifunctional non-homologous end joining protein LigD
VSARAQRLADATSRPVLDRRAPSGAGEPIRVAGIALPRAGEAELEVDGRRLFFTHLDRVLWPEVGFTKAEMIAYYLAVAGVLLPHLRDRPITVGRFPGGVDGRGFAQSEVPGRPSWIRAAAVALANGAVKRFTLVDERASLAWLAQMGAIELHTFLGTLPDLDRPTAVVFDLDPGEPAGLLEAADVALRLRARLADRGLSAWAKTSGSIGMHVLVPLEGEANYADSRALAQRVAAELASEAPQLVVERMALRERAGRVFIDTRQNARRLTTVVPYSLRSASRPTVSTPVTWAELETAAASRDAGGLVFDARAVLARIAPR